MKWVLKLFLSLSRLRKKKLRNIKTNYFLRRIVYTCDRMIVKKSKLSILLFMNGFFFNTVSQRKSDLAALYLHNGYSHSC
jgi:hypothetical protein